MIINEHPLYGMERSDLVERVLQQISRVREPEKVIAKLARRLGSAKAYGKLGPFGLTKAVVWRGAANSLCRA